jgi:Arc/MetJ-type ribon-helix-helix transcriptional regulator
VNPHRSNVEVPIPDSLQHFVTQRLQSGGFDSPAAYLLALIRADREMQSLLQRHSQEKDVEPQLLAGLQSGDAGTLSAEHFDALRKRYE